MTFDPADQRPPQREYEPADDHGSASTARFQDELQLTLRNGRTTAENQREAGQQAESQPPPFERRIIDLGRKGVWQELDGDLAVRMTNHGPKVVLKQVHDSSAYQRWQNTDLGVSLERWGNGTVRVITNAGKEDGFQEFNFHKDGGMHFRSAQAEFFRDAEGNLAAKGEDFYFQARTNGTLIRSTNDGAQEVTLPSGLVRTIGHGGEVSEEQINGSTEDGLQINNVRQVGRLVMAQLSDGTQRPIALTADGSLVTVQDNGDRKELQTSESMKEYLLFRIKFALTLPVGD